MKRDISYMPLWLTANDLARLLGVSKRTIRRWHAEGRIPAPQPFTRRTIRWHREDIHNLLVNGPMPAGSYSKMRRVR